MAHKDKLGYVYIVLYIARNLEMIPKVYGMTSAGYMQILSHCI